MNLFKKNVKYFSNLTYYKTLIEKSKHIREELFPKKIISNQDLIKYANIKFISKNVLINGNAPIDSINAGTFLPCWDLLNRGGKLWRPIFGLIIADYFKMHLNLNKNSDLLYKMLWMTELIHNASLIIDDVEDKSDMRRNEPCIHLKYGEDIAINAGITMLYLPVFSIIKEIKDINLKASLSEVYFEEMAAIHLGQGWDIEMKVKNRIPSVDNYKDTVMFKTGVCPRMIVKLIKILINSINYDEEFNELIDIADNLSIAFQIKDDVLNIVPSTLAKGKGFLGEDIYEGKLTLMVIHTLTVDNKQIKHKERLKEILLMKTKNEKLINEAIGILEINKSIEFANNIMNSHVEVIKNKCEILSKNTNKPLNYSVAMHIYELVNYLIDRNI